MRLDYKKSWIFWITKHALGLKEQPGILFTIYILITITRISHILYKCTKNNTNITLVILFHFSLLFFKSLEIEQEENFLIKSYSLILKQVRRFLSEFKCLMVPFQEIWFG